MKKVTSEYLLTRVICPRCGQTRRQGDMMCGTSKPICKYCWDEKELWHNR